MKKFLNCLLITLLAVAFAFTLVGCDDSSASTQTEAGLKYKTYDGVLTVVGYTNQKNDDGSYVTALRPSDFKENTGAIKANAFSGNSILKSIDLPSTVETIGKGAFAKMTALENLTLPFVGETKDAVNKEKVFGYVFGEAEYEGGVQITQSSSTAVSVSYYIPETLKTVGIFPTEDYEIPAYAFNGVTRVREVMINSLVTKIGDHAFENAYDLRTFTLTESVEEIGASAFVGCTGLTTFNFATTGLKKIGEKAFLDTRLTEISLPEGVTEIGNYCFASSINDSAEVVNGGSRLTKITLPNSLTTIPAYAFYKNENLTEVIYGNALAEIKVASFQGCKNLNKFYKVLENSETAPGDKTISFSGSQNVYSHAFADIEGTFTIVGAPNYDAGLANAFLNTTIA